MNLGLVRQRHIQYVFFFCAIALILQAAYLQLIDDDFRKRADATTIENLRVYPPRGLIVDRRGRLIVNNEATYDLMVIYNQVKQKSMDIPKFCQLLNITAEQFKQNLSKDWKSGRYSRSVPFVFMKKLDQVTYARLQESLYEFPGFFVQVRNIRGYPYHAGAHVLGYINEVDPRDIEKGQGVYEQGDYIGSAGLESQYEPYLRGQKGVTNLLKDNLGRIVGKYKEGKYDSSAVAGSDLVSSIDIDLQLYGEQLMQKKTGSVVVIEPSTGEILCMISGPTYDPALLTMTQNRGQIFSALYTDPLKPFFDRTVMAKYPPGSIFKTLVSLVGLQEGSLYPESGVVCSGGYFYGGRLYKCHNHPHVSNVVDAIANSCNAYFFREFRNIVDRQGFNNPHPSLDMFHDYCKQFGLGRQLGIDYPNESAGNIPNSKYYDKIYPKNLGGWHSPTIMSLGIGQGEIQMTTLQMANLAACIGNRGWWIPPHLAKGFMDGTPLPTMLLSKNQIKIDKRHFDSVVEGMEQCVVRGTARIAQVPGIQVCGKTGTSQNPHGEDHSVFFAFAPKDNPKIAIAVYVENAGWGASYAAPIAGLMIEKYLNDTIATARKAVEERMFKADLFVKHPDYAKMLERKEAEEKNSRSIRRDTLPNPAELPSDVPEGEVPPISKDPKQQADISGTGNSRKKQR
jgi:penicillin-binding protein 2